MHFQLLMILPTFHFFSTTNLFAECNMFALPLKCLKIPNLFLNLYCFDFEHYFYGVHHFVMVDWSLREYEVVSSVFAMGIRTLCLLYRLLSSIFKMGSLVWEWLLTENDKLKGKYKKEFGNKYTLANSNSLLTKYTYSIIISV